MALTVHKCFEDLRVILGIILKFFFSFSFSTFFVL